MNIYIVAATEQELAPARNWCRHNFEQITMHCFQFRNDMIHFACHGVGLLFSGYHLYKITQLQPDLIIQIGIAGAFSDSIPIGDSVIVGKECLADFGAEDNDSFLSIFDLGLLNENDLPFTNQWLKNNSTLPAYFDSFNKYNGATVQKVSGNTKTILQLLEKYNADIETMEGAALHYICNMEKVNYVQLRGISNKVMIRDKSKWKIEEAIQSVNQVAIQYLQTL